MSSADAHALVIGVSQYARLPPLPHTADAEDVASVLRDPDRCGYGAASVAVLEETDATRAAILDQLDRLAQRTGPASTALVYFSGHGGHAGGDSYLMPIDGALGALDATAISSRQLGDLLAAIRAPRLTVILDCCHAAGLAHARDIDAARWEPALADDALGQLAVGRGRVVMAAARGDGAAYVVAGARHGAFTEHLIAGLRGAAAGSDGFVRVLDLYHHVQRNVIARHPAQRPVLKTELEDNYPVAWASRPAPAATASVPAAFAYDALVVYASDERDAAFARALIRLLEERGVRVCTEASDAELGEPRVSELARLVATSRFILPVLTPRFSRDRFAQLQTVMAVHLGVAGGTARLIPIVREPCDVQLHLDIAVKLDLTRDENVGPGVARLAKKLR